MITWLITIEIAKEKRSKVEKSINNIVVLIFRIEKRDIRERVKSNYLSYFV